MATTFRLPIPSKLCDGDRSREREARRFVSDVMLNALAKINAAWVLEQWYQGKTPACCAKCNKTMYEPDELHHGSMPELLTTPDLFARGQGSCGSIAACHTGHKIAEAVAGKFKAANGQVLPTMSWEEACARFYVTVTDGDDPSKPNLFHAQCVDNGTVLNPVIGMKRASR